MPFATPLTELLGIRHPILSAPMDTIAGSRLTRAVSEAGGFGILGGGYGDAIRLRTEAAELKGFAQFGIGFITWSLAKQPDLLDVALDAGPQAIMLSFGDPAPFAPRIRERGARLICQVQSEDMARQALDAGAEILVAQGTEAGGHGASRTTIDIVPAIVDLAAGRVPVVAAGGIADGRGLAAMMMLGASGVLIGTRFYASVEANGAQEAKERIRMATSNDTVRGVVPDWSRKLFWPAPFTARTLVNDHIKRWTGREVELMQRAGEVAEDYAAAKAAGDFETAAVFAGEAAGLIHDIPPAAEIVARIAIEAKQLLEGNRNSVTAGFPSPLAGEGGAQRRMRGSIRGE
ncbi:2-nitropropane dioxygenase [Bradyrhizobium sp. WBOS7]|uniref:2-nitropropane dioxygenase n=1 Tax=Bradyrhizobium betae TaxID=244734 RepID=A0AAE9NFU1_9BRAD|nr:MULTISPECIES: nitronate monooxygenase [Bradyrhizobium]MDD1574674.1 2-nitropropane dioxygenase [Bradyrhizobium sp. WBOS1]UUO37537.1 2-nitropropane dioxygenase [Bradyrhizobium sp. WBOS01]MDD1531201.1 2-nitropropane dioxygenase [Bradyrhizobium sp. WBOS2]MDD1580711.1 2-nitropropane dioxygenase [Bradyrhizobium sp. WBOS7]MDD1604074.1 2-nitropropane dioxygenase [Bradyrhizobium sp. WBOS16]